MFFDASNPDVESVQCAVCENEIRGGSWFARIKAGNRTIALCCPLCVDTFEKNPRAYVLRIETIDLMRRCAAERNQP